ncbi:MAG: EVE domain-containing protein [Alphaproteobacteria bacterium]|nr:EVE domain-containing protein [Alphaproteobacteria bacterium]
MAYWLFKTEPATWSWQDQLAVSVPEQWDGVRNYSARMHMRNMRLGDLGFFYHSVKEKRIMGIVRVAVEIHHDTTTDDPRWECVDVEAVAELKTPVTLEQLKADERFRDMVLVNNNRLSVQPVTAREWKLICELGGIDP